MNGIDYQPPPITNIYQPQIGNINPTNIGNMNPPQYGNINQYQYLNNSHEKKFFGKSLIFVSILSQTGLLRQKWDKNETKMRHFQKYKISFLSHFCLIFVSKVQFEIKKC